MLKYFSHRIQFFDDVDFGSYSWITSPRNGPWIKCKILRRVFGRLSHQKTWVQKIGIMGCLKDPYWMLRRTLLWINVVFNSLSWSAYHQPTCCSSVHWQLKSWTTTMLKIILSNRWKFPFVLFACCASWVQNNFIMLWYVHYLAVAASSSLSE